MQAKKKTLKKQLYKKCKGGIDGIMIKIIGNGHSDSSLNLGVVCISHRSNNLGKGINPTILLLAMGKIIGMVTSLGE